MSGTGLTGERRGIAPRDRSTAGIVSSLVSLAVVLLVAGSVPGPLLQAQERTASAFDGDSPGSSPERGKPSDHSPGGAQESSEATSETPLSTAELKELARKGRIRKLVEQKFRRQPRAGSRFARVDPEDLFVAARFEMPLSTGQLDVRFEVLSGVEAASEQIADYVLSTPQRTMRDFLVVARYGSAAEADEGLLAARNQYDKALAYQAQLMAYIRAQQQVQVRSTRRC